jgi:hypothetical protein
MATKAKDRESPVDRIMRDVPFNDLEKPPSELARSTPLTREAVIHLRAAASEVDSAFPRLQAILGAVKRALKNPVVGDDLTIDEDTAFDLRQLLDAAIEIADVDMNRPVFARGRGERPHGDGPHLSLDQDGLDKLAVQLCELALLAIKANETTESPELAHAFVKETGKRADEVLQWVEERAGTDLYDDDLHARASGRVEDAREQILRELGSENGAGEGGAA